MNEQAPAQSPTSSTVVGNLQYRPFNTNSPDFSEARAVGASKDVAVNSTYDLTQPLQAAETQADMVTPETLDTSPTGNGMPESKPLKLRDGFGNLAMDMLQLTAGEKPFEPVALLTPGDPAQDSRNNRPSNLSHETGQKDKDKNKAEYEFPNHLPVRYDTRQDGRTQLGIQVDEPGSVIEFGTHDKTKDPDDRKIIVTDTDGNEFLIRNRNLYGLGTLEDPELKLLATSVDKLSDINVGQPWKGADGALITEHPIEIVEVATGFADENTDLNAYGATNGIDGFERAENIMNESVIKGADQRLTPRVSNPNHRSGIPKDHNDDPPTIHDLEGDEPTQEMKTVLMGDRPRQLMDWARNKLSKLKSLPTLGAVKAQNKLQGAREQQGGEEKNKRRKIIAAVVGGFATVGTAYLAIKGGHNVMDLLADGPHGGGAGELTQSLGKPSAHNSLVDVVSSSRPPSTHTAHEHVQTVTMHRGDTLWDMSEHQKQIHGNPHPSLPETDDLKDRVLKRNNWTEYQARHLPSDTKVEMPTD